MDSNIGEYVGTTVSNAIISLTSNPLAKYAGFFEPCVKYRGRNSLPALIEDKVNNCPFVLEVKKEHDDQSTTPLNTETTNKSSVKLEPAWEHYEIEYMHEQKKLESHFEIETVKPILKGSKETFSDASVKNENNKSVCEIGNCLKAVDDNCNIKYEEVDINNEGFQYEIRSKDISSEGSVKTESNETLCKIEKSLEVVDDRWEIKNEEVDIKLEDLENEISVPSQRLCDQGNSEDLMHKNREGAYLFRCNKCAYQTTLRRDLKKHSFKHKNAEVDLFECDKCNYKTINKECLQIHSLMHKSPEEIDLFRCDNCDFKTVYKRSLKGHFLKHQNREEMNLFRCDKCDFKTCWKHSLKKHSVIQHENPQELQFFRCDKCAYETRWKYDLNRHSIKHKNREEIDLFRCDKCDFKTIYKRNVGRHCRLH